MSQSVSDIIFVAFGGCKFRQRLLVGTVLRAVCWGAREIFAEFFAIAFRNTKRGCAKQLTPQEGG